MIAATQSHFAVPKLSLVAVVPTTTLSLLNALGFPTQMFSKVSVPSHWIWPQVPGLPFHFLSPTSCEPCQTLKTRQGGSNALGNVLSTTAQLTSVMEPKLVGWVSTLIENTGVQTRWFHVSRLSTECRGVHTEMQPL